jgi:hypothetical protein
MWYPRNDVVSVSLRSFIALSYAVMLFQYSREAKPSSFGSKTVLGSDSDSALSSLAVTTFANERMSLMVLKSGRDAMNWYLKERKRNV